MLSVLMGPDKKSSLRKRKLDALNKPATATVTATPTATATATSASKTVARADVQDEPRHAIHPTKMLAAAAAARQQKATAPATSAPVDPATKSASYIKQQIRSMSRLLNKKVCAGVACWMRQRG